MKKLAVGLITAMTIGMAPVGAASAAPSSFIVVGRSAASAALHVERVGGEVTSRVELIDAVVAQLDPGEVTELEDTLGIASVTPDREVTLQQASFEGTPAGTMRASTGATDLHDDGIDGSGVGVALLDTGIADHPDLAGRVVASVDLTSENNYTDSYGHGTFLAGLIAGDGSSSGGRYTGMAPGAHLMSVKVSGADGAITLGQVLYGLQLIDASKETYGIRVVALALSSPPTAGPDPLVMAVERLWADGLVVVAAAGNTGTTAGAVSSPGIDPYIITTGASNENGTADPADDTVPEWSGRGPSVYGMSKPDVVAPGTSLVAARATGSTLDGQYPVARVGDAYFRGSGTSMATAVTAGAAALLLDADPSLSPDEVKGRLMDTAADIAGDPSATGSGSIDVAAAAASSAGPANADLPPLPAKGPAEVPADPHPGAKGSTFGWSQGSDGVDRWAGRGWGGRGWGGSDWSGRGWGSSSWAGRGWAGRGWAGQRWSGSDWAGRGWAGATWAAALWR